MNLKSVTRIACIAAMGLSTSGCVVAAAAGAGVLVHDELTEDDGEFDPLEKVEDALDDDDNK
ncbi:MAG: hypothetical protein ABL957_01075 [Parvularculaceae bacterium]